MTSFPLRILAADRPFFEGECESLVIPTPGGAYGVLAGHRNTIAAVVPGTLRYRQPGQETAIASISDGIMKIERGEVLLLVETAEHPEEIDADEAQRQMEEAREAMLQQQSIRDYQLTRARMARSLARLQTKHQREERY